MNQKVGIWLIGAYGNVATCTVLGILALKHNKTSETGLVSSLPEFKDVPFANLSDIVIGGHDIRKSDYYSEALKFHEQNNCIDLRLIDLLEPELKKASNNIKTGFTISDPVSAKFASNGAAETNTAAQIVKSIQNDLLLFQKTNKLKTVVVINLASAEPSIDEGLHELSKREFVKLITRNNLDRLRASLLYAYSALDAGFPYVNFASSTGSSINALNQLALERKVPHFGRDAKTGETLVKTVLAPMFRVRNLDVMSWEGHNILGNRDGYVLTNPDNKKEKVSNKNGVLRDLLKKQDGHFGVRIDYVPSLSDWKTAWDFIHFKGFLGVKMNLQFIWQGCDSILAAPLVIDLLKWAELSYRSGLKGPMHHLAFYFKAPYCVKDHNLMNQFDGLVKFAKTIGFVSEARTKKLRLTVRA